MRMWCVFALLLAALFCGCEPQEVEGGDPDSRSDPLQDAVHAAGDATRDGEAIGGDAAEVVDAFADASDGAEPDDSGDCDGPGEELCNNADDNCNGEIDEEFGLGDDCTVGVGACAVAGVIECKSDGTAECSATAGFPAAERCDGIDNDCDGEVDEEFALGDACTVGIGLCAATGQRVCGQDGNAVCGAIAGAPLPELCDGLDNNCDGVVDDVFPTLGEACTVGVGALTDPLISRPTLVG